MTCLPLQFQLKPLHVYSEQVHYNRTCSQESALHGTASKVFGYNFQTFESHLKWLVKCLLITSGGKGNQNYFLLASTDIHFKRDGFFYVAEAQS